MATLHVRNVPDLLYERLRRQAEAENRSLSAEVIILLNRTLDTTSADHGAVVADIRRRRAFEPAAVVAPDSTSTLRAMRDSNALAYAAEHETVLDEELIAEARRIGRHISDHDALTTALEEYITRRQQQTVVDLFGTIDYDPEYDYKAQRDRS